jgi:hypothetical protein
MKYMKGTRKVKVPLLLLLLALASFSMGGCQYSFGRGELASQYSTIYVPYAEGDKEGDLTTQVIKCLSLRGFRYVNYGGDLILNMKIFELRDENIGFRYDRKKCGKLKKVIIPTETRVTMVVEVTVIETSTGKTIRGPTRIKTSLDFDHDFYSSHHGVNIFSLGQLNDIDAAHNAVMKPLHRQMAERIVDYVINSW